METMSSEVPIIVIVGETASGKTSAAIKLAQKIGGEIICADSRTVYKQMNISTAKPKKTEQLSIPHHMIDVVDPNQKFSAADFKVAAKKCIQEIHDRGHFPVVVGGTGLYIDSLLYDFQFSNKPNLQHRELLEQMSDEELTTLLNTKNIDLTRLNTKNRRHVIRAIERGENPPVNDILRANTLVVGINLDREVIKARIAKRAEQIFKNGFLVEIKNVADRFGWNNKAMSGSLYDQVRSYFEGNTTEIEVKNAFIKRDLSLAKRQRTWFKRNKHIVWFNDINKLTAVAVEFTKRFDYN